MSDEREDKEFFDRADAIIALANSQCDDFPIINGSKYATVDTLRNAIRDYIVNFYNQSRLHSSLNYYSPNEFE